MRFTLVSAFFAGTSVVVAQELDDLKLRMHTQLITAPLMDDIMQIKLVVVEPDKTTVVCKFGGLSFFSSNEETYCAFGEDGINDGRGCREGWAACVWDNGRQASVTAHREDGEAWEWDLSVRNGGGIYTYDCAPCWDNRCTKCSDWESCLDNGNFGDAPKEDCPTCEHRGNYECLEGDESGF